MMANHRIVDGKTTLQRLEDEFQNLLDSGERITVVEFAHRVGISSHTLNHRYRDWAEKLRKLRDEGRPKPRKRSPVTRSREEIQNLDEAEDIITQLRQRVSDLSSQVEALKKDYQKLKKRVRQGELAQEQNERLRGVLVSLQQEIVRYMTHEQSSRLLLMIEEHAAIPLNGNS
jgi:chromosome segregation ATPase